MSKKQADEHESGLFGKVRSAIGGATGKVQDTFEEWMGNQSQVNEAQLHALLEMLGSYKDIAEQLATHPGRLAKQEVNLLKSHGKLLLNSAKKLIGKEADAVATPDKTDKRFAADEWEKNVLFDYIKQAYLLNSQAVSDLVDSLESSPEHSQEQLKFYTRQLVNALSPSNFLLTNPEVLKVTLSRKGGNLADGIRNLMADLKKSPGLLNISMTDYTAFEVGKNVATTPGKVICQTPMMQLIHYTPTTETVNQTPVLILPPWINKYYILDLKAKNSLVKWLVDQGHQVFMVSWVNPGPELRDKGFEHYMTEGSLAALDAIEKATGEKSTNVIGYCVGGTLLACTMAYLAARKKAGRVRSATYLTTLLDFSDPGGIGVFIDDKTIKAIERQGKKAGYYDGRAMAFSFNLLRENDLLWSFVVNNYLKGEKPAAFDLLYWNSDGTNLTGAMHGWYLRNMYLENRLIQPGQIELAGVKLDLGKIKTPVYFLSTVQDHIAKWKTTYTGTQLHGGPVTFVLSGSGHIAGVVNPPVPEKYGYWTNPELPSTPDAWLGGATQHAGSWWLNWNDWIQPFVGEKVRAVAPGEGGMPALEDAPGSYVKQRIADVLHEKS
ncbi:MAG: class I poly(R)-hydroxyalkanoic acid synthase [Hahellaceae bacterium]|nr:class I poly(R)-hydroxyalkanoic acid synthase [Hahellaceae bacterium]